MATFRRKLSGNGDPPLLVTSRHTDRVTDVQAAGQCHAPRWHPVTNILDFARSGPGLGRRGRGQCFLIDVAIVYVMTIPQKRTDTVSTNPGARFSKILITIL